MPSQYNKTGARFSSWRPSMKNFGAIGKAEFVLDGYVEAELLNHIGEGCLTHMWFGGSWPGYAFTRIRVYVDGEMEPSIDMAMGLGHGYGFGDDAAPWGCGKMGKTGEPSGVYNTLKIPFGKQIRVTAQLHHQSPDGNPFWWILRGVEHLPLIVGGIELPSNARLKLHRLEPYTANPLEEFALCNLGGAGVLLQVTIAARPLGENLPSPFAYLEACIRAYIDSSPDPLMLSSGLEDYFTGTYYFNRGRFANDLAGLTHFDETDGSFSAYRFHDDDPIFFANGFRLTCRCGETDHGTEIGPANAPTPTTEYQTYTWVYQW